MNRESGFHESKGFRVWTNHLLDLLEVACRRGDGRGDGRGHEKLLGLLAGELLAKHLQLNKKQHRSRQQAGQQKTSASQIDSSQGSSWVAIASNHS